MSRLGLAVPSEPRPPSRPSVHLEAQDGGRAGRIPLAVGLGVVLVLVAIPLYLWRRPRVESVAAANVLSVEGVASGRAAPAAPPAEASAPAGVGGAPVDPTNLPSGVQIGEPRVLACSDGGKKVGGEGCDRLPTIERALSRAVEESASCLAHDAGPGSIQFAFDVGFRKKAIGVTTPREARSIKSPKAVAACAAQVRSKLSGRLLEGVPHGHERYRIVVTAAFPAPKPAVARPKL